MPKVRLDSLPLDLRQQAMGGQAAVNKRETDPAVIGALSMRHGSEREAISAPALGVTAEGKLAYYTSVDTIAATTDFTYLFNLKWDGLSEAGSYPILTLRKSTTSTHFYQVSLIKSGADTKFTITAKDGDTSASATSAAQSTNTSGGLALVKDDTTLTLYLNGSSIATTSISGSVPTGPFFLDLLGTFVGINAYAGKPVVSGQHPILSNLKYDNSAKTITDNLDDLRSSDGWDFHWNLDGEHPISSIPTTVASTYRISAVPSSPVVQTIGAEAGTWFNGTSGALFLRHTPSLDVYYSTSLNASNASEFGFQIEGVRSAAPLSEIATLLDYGGVDGLCLIKILSNGKVSFTMNETVVTTAGAIFSTSKETFTIFAGRDEGVLKLRCIINGGTPTDTTSGATTSFTPALDLNAIPNLYYGAGSNPDSTDRFKGFLTRIAMYPSYFEADGGTSLAEFRLDLTVVAMTDSSPNTRKARLINHDSSENLEPVYAVGGIVDAPFVSVEGGLVLSASGPINFTSKISRRLGSDVTSSRLGQLSFLTSGAEAHVSNHERKIIRSLGIPQPNRNVSQESLGGGTLAGAYSYGYRFTSDLGTAGPLLRLDPVLAQNERVMLGRPRDPDYTALGETYLICTKDTGELGRVEAAVPTAASAEYPVEIFAKLADDEDDLDLKESIFHRGAKATAGSLGMRSNSNANDFLEAGNWTMQASFKLDLGETPHTAICGYGPNDTKSPSYANRGSYQTVGFGAYLTQGGEYNNYGKNTSPRLVVMGGIRDHQSWYRWPRGGPQNRRYDIICFQHNNYKGLTFTNDGDGWWHPGAYYSIYFVRNGAKLSVYCSKRANENSEPVWKELEGRTGMRNGYSSDNFFDAEHYPLVQRAVTGFGIGHMPRVSAIPILFNGSGDGQNWGEVNFYNEDNYPAPHKLTQIREMGPDAIIYAFRVWETALNPIDLQDHGEERFACFPSEPLTWKIYIDFFPYFPPGTQMTDVFLVGNHARNVEEEFLGIEYSTRRAAQVSEMSGEHPGTALAPREIPFLTIGEPGNNVRNSAGKLFLTDIGDGSLVVEVGGTDVAAGYESEGRMTIAELIWNEDYVASPLIVNRNLFSNINPWHVWNWFSFQLILRPSDAGGNVRALSIQNLVVNGELLFYHSIGGWDGENSRISTWTAGWAWLGNDSENATAATKDLGATVHIGSFRVWKAGKGPNVEMGTSYNYLTNRVSENEYLDLEHYYQFRPGDWNIGTTPNLVEDFGIRNKSLVLEDDALLSRLPGTTVGVAFPNSSNETIAGIEIFRSKTAAVADWTNNNDQQVALDIARNAAQFFLGAITIGTTDYIDSADDSVLTEVADYTSGYIPNEIVSMFVWADSLVILDAQNRLWPSKAGAIGWETYSDVIRIPNAHGPAIGAINIQGERNKAMVLISGRSWATILSGNVHSPTSHILGGGVGAESQRCMTHHSGMAFTYNGKLWAIQQGAAVDFGGPVQDLLPDPANARLTTSAKLSSLFVIDEVSGTALRFHFPTKQWTVEERYAAAGGDLEDGTDAWVNVSGSWSKGNTSVYGDDVKATTRATITASLTKGSDRVVTSSDISAELHVGMPICIVDSAGVAFGTQIVVLDDEEITTLDLAASGLTDGATNSANIYFGAGATGLLLDTGPMDAGDDSIISPKVLVDKVSGTGWEYAAHATKFPGARGVLPSLTYTAMSSNSGYRASGVRGRFQRVVIRNRKREAAQLPLLEIELN